jgi:hypothetical protein
MVLVVVVVSVLCLNYQRGKLVLEFRTNTQMGTEKFQMCLQMQIRRRDMQRIVRSQMQVVLQQAGLPLGVQVRQRHYGLVAWH